MRIFALLLTICLLAPPAMAGRAIRSVSRGYTSLGVRAVGQEPSVIAVGQTVETEVLSTSKLVALGFQNVRAGDHLMITGVSDTEFKLALGKAEIKVKVDQDGAVTLAK